MDRPTCKHGNDLLNSPLLCAAVNIGAYLDLASLNSLFNQKLFAWKKYETPMAGLRTSMCGYDSCFSCHAISVTVDSPLTQVDRSLVLSKGKRAVAKLLIELQVRKSTADAKGSREFYNNLTKPIQGWEGEIRDFVLQKKQVGF
jgi:hypothetical protein